MTTDVEEYLVNGCGRCPLGNTPQCKVHAWSEILISIRTLLKSTQLVEECKWGVPCYTHNGRNVAMLSALKSSCCISFFKGSLIDDQAQILEKSGPNSHVGRVIKITTLDQVNKYEEVILQYITQAIGIEEKGLKVEPNPYQMDIPTELQDVFDEDQALMNAFYSLTPGRQRGYLIYFSGAAKSETRTNRIEKFKSQIMAGVGMHDRYGK